MNIIFENFYFQSFTLKKLSEKEIAEIYQSIKEETAKLDYYTNLYNLFQYIKFGQNNNYYFLIMNALSESIFTLSNLGMDIPKNKTIDNIIEEDNIFRVEMMKKVLYEIPKNIDWSGKKSEMLISVINSIENPRIKKALIEYKNTITDLHHIKSSIERSVHRINNSSLSVNAQQLDYDFANLSSLWKVIYIGIANDPYSLVGQEIINYFYAKKQEEIITEEEFNKFIKEAVNDLLDIFRDYPDSLAAESIIEFISGLYSKAATNKVTIDSYRSFLDDEIKNRMDNDNLSTTLMFLNKFCDRISNKLEDCELHRTTIESVIKGFSHLEDWRSYYKIMRYTFSAKNNIADANNLEDLKIALDEATKLEIPEEKTPILLFLNMIDNFDEEKIEVILNYLRANPKIIEDVIISLEQEANTKPNTKCQINELIQRIKTLPKEQPELEISKSKGQKKLPTKPTPA